MPRRAVRQRGYGLQLLIFKMANNLVDLGQIRSEEIVYSRFTDIFQGETLIKSFIYSHETPLDPVLAVSKPGLFTS